MFTESPRLRLLSGNALKIIAAVIMVCDHVGALIFPEILIFRMIGRIGFPIFAYLIAEGAKYTRNKLRHVLVMAGFAAAMQVVYYFVSHSLEMNALVTFTLSLLIIYALDGFKSTVFSGSSSPWRTAVSALLLVAAIALAVIMDRSFDLDYGLGGCLLPVFPALFTTPKVSSPPRVFKTVDTKTFRVFSLAIGTLALAVDSHPIQYLALLSVPILLLYSEKRGRLNLKYFFYIFYPLHLAVIQGIAILIAICK